MARDSLSGNQSAGQTRRDFNFSADEAGLRSGYYSGATWAPRTGSNASGEGDRYRLWIQSHPGSQCHRPLPLHDIEGTVTASVLQGFLQHLVTGMDRRIFLTVDSHPTHRARLVKHFVAVHADSIKLFMLPPYSPELNPDELAWAHIKTQVAKMAPKTKNKL